MEHRDVLFANNIDLNRNFNVKYGLPKNPHNYTWQKTSIYDVFGNRVKLYDMVNSGQSIKIDISTIPDGIYLCVVQSNNLVIGSNKIMIIK